MSLSDPMTTRVGYVVKRYPRYSETFIVTEVLAHEAAGIAVEIYSLLPSNDTHFQDAVSRVRAPVRYLAPDGMRASDFWEQLQSVADASPGGWEALEAARGADAREVYQAILLARQVRERGITHLHAHFATAAASVARMAARFAGVAYSFTAHAKDIYHEDVNPTDFRRKLEDAAGVVTVSDYNEQYLRSTYGPAASRVRRVYNGLDLRRLEFRASQDRPALIISVGRLVEKKGFGDLIAACAVLRDRGLNFRCRIVGEGDEEQRLRALIGELGLAGVVELVGPRPQNEVFGLIAEAAVFAAPCVVGEDQNRDGLPTVLVEAMALGTACVATDVTGIPEVIRHGQTGLVVQQRSPAELADAIGQLLAEPATRRRLAGAARALVEQEFDVSRNSALIRRMFDDAAAAGCRDEQIVQRPIQLQGAH